MIVIDIETSGIYPEKNGILEAECLFRLVYGKNLFKEFFEFKIPDYLKNDNL